MKLIPIYEYASPVPVVSGVGAKNTISSGPDDGANNLLASHFWQPMRHGSTQQAINNSFTAMLAEASSSTGELNMCGHGNEGLLETGMGQTGPFDVGQIILTWNEYDWGPQLDRIRSAPITQVSIWSCHTGAGQDGADLLFAMAKRCQRGVRAGTGFLYSNNQSTWWENGSVWQVATPGFKPPAIAAPSQHSLMSQNPQFSVQGRILETSDVKHLEVSIQPFAATASINTVRIEGSRAQFVVAALFRSPAMDMKVGISGIVTAILTVIFTGDLAATFDVYNDRLAVDRTSKIGYYISPSFRSVAADVKR